MGVLSAPHCSWTTFQDFNRQPLDSNLCDESIGQGQRQQTFYTVMLPSIDTSWDRIRVVATSNWSFTLVLRTYYFAYRMASRCREYHARNTNFISSHPISVYPSVCFQQEQFSQNIYSPSRCNAEYQDIKGSRDMLWPQLSLYSTSVRHGAPAPTHGPLPLFSTTLRKTRR